MFKVHTHARGWQDAPTLVQAMLVLEAAGRDGVIVDEDGVIRAEGRGGDLVPCDRDGRPRDDRHARATRVYARLPKSVIPTATVGVWGWAWTALWAWWPGAGRHRGERAEGAA